MRYSILVSEVIKYYKIDQSNADPVKLQHNTGNSIQILPYTTNFKKTDKDYIQNFQAVLGEFIRLLTNKKIKEGFSKQSLLDTLTKKVQFEKADDKSTFIDIISNVFFDNKGDLKTFHPQIYNYVFTEKNYVHKKVAQFLFCILSDEETRSLIRENLNTVPKNILYRLILEALPDLSDDTLKNEKERYKLYIPFISKLFNQDLRLMIENNKFFIEDFEKLMKYYYFFYVSQLAIKLSQMFDSDLTKPDEVYFSLDSEAISKSRTCYIKGWDRVKSNLKNLFPHANCLEILNHRGIESEGPFSYPEIREEVEELNEEESLELLNNLNYLISLYKECICDVDWSTMGSLGELYSNVILNKMCELYKVVNFQFNNSQRIERCKHYFEWFEDYCKSNFLRTRGQLGYTLNLTEEYLIFITKLCIPRGEKMRLNLLFKEYELRGICFDRDSKYKIIEIFEKLNVLEKKSDSGDAQYVKSIL